MTMETCLEVAARIWCDPDFSHVVMDAEAAKHIATILYSVAKYEEDK